MALTPQSTMRRYGASLVALAGAAAVTVACSSTRNGTPQPAGTSSGRHTSAAVSTSSLPSASASTSRVGGGGSAGSQSQFCQDFTSGQADRVPSTSGSKAAIARVAKVWASIAADAPAAIKADAQKVSKFLNDFVQDKIDPAAAQQATPAIQRVLTYFSAHCTGG